VKDVSELRELKQSSSKAIQKEAIISLQNLVAPGKFYKKGSQEKTVPHRLESFLLRSPRD
jgi:hypothetical protein